MYLPAEGREDGACPAVWVCLHWCTYAAAARALAIRAASKARGQLELPLQGRANTGLSCCMNV